VVEGTGLRDPATPHVADDTVETMVSLLARNSAARARGSLVERVRAQVWQSRDTRRRWAKAKAAGAKRVHRMPTPSPSSDRAARRTVGHVVSILARRVVCSADGDPAELLYLYEHVPLHPVVTGVDREEERQRVEVQ
jgi:hypothetical protein